MVRKIEEGKEAAEVEAYQMAEEREMMEVRHKKAEEENKWLRWEMEELRTGFAAQKEELEGKYQK